MNSIRNDAATLADSNSTRGSVDEGRLGLELEQRSCTGRLELDESNAVVLEGLNSNSKRSNAVVLVDLNSNSNST